MKASYRLMLALGVTVAAVSATAQLAGNGAQRVEGLEEASLENPVDCSEFIVNPSFADGTTGWTNPNSVKHWSGTLFEEMECWNGTVNCYQVISGLPAGVYELRVNAFYRCGDTSSSWALHPDGDPLNAVYYAGGSEKAIMSFYDCPDMCPTGGQGVSTAGAMYDAWDNSEDGHRYPNGMYSAQEAFESGGYLNTGLYFLADGTSDVQIGLRKSVSVQYDWMVWDNFQLLYVGQGDAAYAKVVDGFIENLDYDAYADNTDVSDAMIERFKKAYEALKAASESGEGIRAAVEELNAAKGAIDSYVSNMETVDNLYMSFPGLNVSDELAAKVQSAYDETVAAIELGENVEEALASYKSLVTAATDIDNLYGQYAGSDVSESLTNRLEETFKAAEAALVAGSDYEEAVAAFKAVTGEVSGEVTAYSNLRTYLEGSGADFYGDSRYQNADGFAEWTALYDAAEAAVDAHTYSAEEANAVMEKLKDDSQYIRGNAMKPGDDITEMLLNTSFDGSDAYGMTSIDGWTLTGDDGVSFTRGYNMMESFAGDKGPSFKISQTLKGVKAGVYTIRCQAFVRPGYRGQSDYENGNCDNDIQSYIFGNANKTKIKSIYADRRSEGFIVDRRDDNGELVWYIDSKFDDGTYVPNCLESVRQFFDDETYTDEVTGNKGRYWNEVRVFVSKDANVLELGFMGTASTDWYWTAFDNFQLIYSGNEFTTIKEMCQEALDEASQYEDANMNGTVKAEFKSIMDKVSNAIAAQSGDELLEAYPLLLDVNPRVAASVAVYTTLEEARLNAGDVADGYDITDEVRNEFNAYLSTIDQNIENGVYADAEVPSVIDEINAQLAGLRVKGFDFSGATAANPKDCTDLLEDADFDQTDGAGWLGDQLTYRGGTVSEQYNKAYHTYQILSGMPKGVYKVEVHAFYREGWPEGAYNLYRNGTANEQYNVKAYANQDTILLQPVGKGAIAMSELVNAGDDEEPYWLFGDDEVSEYGDKVTFTVDEQKDSVYMPNSMSQAQQMFDFSTKYDVQEFRTEVGDNGILQIGFKHDAYTGGDWTMFNEIHLYYLGMEGYDAIESVASAADAAKVEVFSIDGTSRSRLQKGVNVVKTTLKDGSVKVQKVLVK